MKNRIFLFIVTAFSLLNYTNITAQNIGSFYLLKVDHRFHETDIAGNTNGYIEKTLPGGSKFTVIGKTTTGDYVVKFWNWGTQAELNAIVKTATSTAGTLNFIPGSTPIATGRQQKSTETQHKIESFNLYFAAGAWHQRYFLIPGGDFTAYTEELTSVWSPAVGVATLPFKYRPGTHEFSKDLSISGLGGIRHMGLFGHLTTTSFSTLVGIGVASVTLNSDNTNGTLTKSSDFAAISISLGEVVEWKRLQIGVFAGWDSVQKTDKNNWQNQGKIWVGFGIGFSIFSESSPGKEGKN